MKDPNFALRRAYFQRLNGALNYNGENVPVYNRPPDEDKYPFVVLSSQTSIDESNKTSYQWECTLLVDVVTGFDGNYGGFQQADYIANQIIGLIRTRQIEYLDLGEDFQMVTSTVDDMTTIDSQSNSHYICRKLIRFRHIINQLTDKVHE